MNEITFNVEQKNGVITVNFDEIKEQLAAGMEEYRGMVFTEDSKADAKKTVASLRKFKKSISDRRIEVKKNFMQPYTEFEMQVKELDKLIDEPINFINGQVEEFERKRVAERKKEIDAIYAECIGELEDYLPLLKIYDYKWDNATTSKKSIREDIEERVKTVRHDIETIKDMQTDAVDKALDKYKATLNLADAITFINNWEKQKAEILKRQEEAARAAEEEQNQQTEPTKNVAPPLEETPSGEDTVKKTDETLESGLKEVTFIVKADMLQLAQLESAFNEFGIEYRRI